MERSDTRGCFLLVILALGGAGTHSKHFPQRQEIKTKQVHQPDSPKDCLSRFSKMDAFPSLLISRPQLGLERYY